MTEIIALVNQKGGVGKTTSSINIAACLASLGKKTLLIDADSQANSTSGLGIDKKNLKNNLYHFLIEDEPLKNIIMPSTVKNLFVAPANLDLLGINQDLMQIESKETHLKKQLNNNLINLNYEYIIIDSPPNLDLMFINIMTAATKIIIPTLPEYLALEGLADLIDTYARIRETLNPNLSILGVLITKYISTNNLSKEVSYNLRNNMGALVFETIIPQNVRVAESPSFCLPIILYDPKSSGAISYQILTKEILNRLKVNNI